MSNDELFPGMASEAAKAMSALGASKGGKARANTMTPTQRSEVARNAVRTRWLRLGKLKEEKPEPESDFDKIEPSKGVADDSMPFSMFKGTLTIGDMKMECHVLNDFRRVFTQTEMVRVLTAGKGSTNLDVHVRGNPLIDNELSAKKIVEFKIAGNPQIAKGREATVLIEICDKYLEARDQKVLRTSGQRRYALQAEIIMRACAKVGIIALIDEATGFQQYRAKRDLQLKLQAFIADDLQEWARMFKDEFWLELARLENIHYSPRSRPLRWGKYIMMFVYDAIDKDVGKALREKNPNPRFLKNHHQWLQKFGRDKVHDQIERVITVMKLCKDMADFREKFAKVFNKSPQTSFDEINWSADVRIPSSASR
jgi:hypothetical protein